MSRAWLKAKRASYFEDARRLAAMGSEEVGGLTGEQWGIVYRAVADELDKCASEVNEERALSHDHIAAMRRNGFGDW